MYPLCGGMGMLSVALSLPLAEDCASKKVAGDICFPEKKKKKKKALILPTGVRDGDRDRPQLSPAAPIGWQFVQNPTQSTSLTTHQQILKAYMQPPPSLRRCSTASNPHTGAQRLTFIRAVFVLRLKKKKKKSEAAAAESAAWFGVFLSARTPFIICSEFDYFCWRKQSRQRTLQPSIPG